MATTSATPVAPHVTFLALPIAILPKILQDRSLPHQNVVVVRILPLATPMIEIER